MWRDQIKSHLGSFRGVPFSTVDAEARIGRRVVVHEYPGRDLPYTEDLGRRARVFSIEAYVIGDNYLDQRDSLIEAIEEEGPGELVHPRYGALWVSVQDYVPVRETPKEGGIARFSITFVESGENTFPNPREDTVAQVDDAATELEEASLEAFVEEFDIDGSSVLQAEASTLLTGILEGVEEVVQTVMNVARAGAMVREIQGMVASLPALIGAPLDFATGLLDLHVDIALSTPRPLAAFNVFQEAFTTNVAPSDDLLQAARPGSTRARLLVLRGTCVRLVRCVSLGAQARSLAVALAAADAKYAGLARPPLAIAARAAARLSANGVPVSKISFAEQVDLDLPITTAAKARQLRTLLLDQIDAELEDNDPPAAAARALRRLRTAVIRDVARRAEMLRRTSSFKPAIVLPSLVLAQRIYGNAMRATELELRNGVRHPAFVPARDLETVR